MKKTFYVETKIAAKYCLYDSKYFHDHNEETIAFCLDFSHYNKKDEEYIGNKEYIKYTSNENKKYEKLIGKLRRTCPEIESHIGNIFYIISYELETFKNNETQMKVDAAMFGELERTLFLQKLVEADDDRMNNFEVVIRDKSNRDNIPPKVLSKDAHVNRIMISQLLDVYKDLLRDYQQEYNLLSKDFVNSLEDINSVALEEYTDRLKFKTPRRNSIETNKEKEMIRLLLKYINEETSINMKKEKMPGDVAQLIYYSLSIFNISTKPGLKEELKIVDRMTKTHFRKDVEY